MTPASTNAVPALLRAMRPSQWVKNVLVFAAPVAAGQLLDGAILFRSIIAFVAFSLAASATYLFNDAADVDADRLHPAKRHRPIAAGELSERFATRFGALMAAVAITIGLIAEPRLGFMVIAYLLLTTAYSAKLKHLPIIDVVAVSAGFTLRAVGGGFAADIPLSQWFVLVVSSGALLLITGKRMAEFRSAHGNASTRPVLDHYSFGSLRALLLLAAGSGIVGYALWASGEAAEPDRLSIAIWLSFLPFALGVARYTWLSDEGRGETPDKLVFRDRIIVGLGVAWSVAYLAAVYG